MAIAETPPSAQAERVVSDAEAIEVSPETYQVQESKNPLLNRLRLGAGIVLAVGAGVIGTLFVESDEDQQPANTASTSESDSPVEPDDTSIEQTETQFGQPIYYDGAPSNWELVFEDTGSNRELEAYAQEIDEQVSEYITFSGPNVTVAYGTCLNFTEQYRDQTTGETHHARRFFINPIVVLDYNYTSYYTFSEGEMRRIATESWGQDGGISSPDVISLAVKDFPQYASGPLLSSIEMPTTGSGPNSDWPQAPLVMPENVTVPLTGAASALVVDQGNLSMLDESVDENEDICLELLEKANTPLSFF